MSDEALRRDVIKTENFDLFVAHLFDVDRVNGRPSIADVEEHEIPMLMELLAEDFYGNTEPIDTRPGMRALSAEGRKFFDYSIVNAELNADGAVEMVEFFVYGISAASYD